MTKRELASITKKIEAMTAKIGKKRDELRELVGQVGDLISSIEDAGDEMDWAVECLQSAKRHVDDAAEKMSEVV